MIGEEFHETSSGIFAWNVTSATRNVLVTTVFGGTYLKDFVKFSLPYWKRYALRNEFGIILLSDGSVSRAEAGGLNGAWLKLLAPSLVQEHFAEVERVAIVDSDTIINPSSPNIFHETPTGRVGVVPEFPARTGELISAKKRLAYLRKNFYDSSYPLDSILFASPEQMFLLEGFPPRNESFCSGLLVLDTVYAQIFASWFREARDTQTSQALAWEQTFLNYKVLHETPYTWLDQRFQAIWNLEMAAYHPSLYALGSLDGEETAQHCVADTLNRVFFLHFAGSWPESRAWKNPPLKIFEKMMALDGLEYSEYLSSPSTGSPVGKVTAPPSLEKAKGSLTRSYRSPKKWVMPHRSSSVQ